MTIVTSLLTQLSNAMTSIFLLFLTVVFMLLEVPQLPAKLQQIMVRPVEGMGAIQRALDSVSRYLVLKTAISLVTGLVVWVMLLTLDVRFAFVWGYWRLRLTTFPTSAPCWRRSPYPSGAGFQRALWRADPAGRIPGHQSGVR